jgi:hypothetical protein
MHITLKLIINYGNLITSDSSASELLYINFGKFDDNATHVFNHFLVASEVRLVFA